MVGVGLGVGIPLLVALLAALFLLRQERRKQSRAPPEASDLPEVTLVHKHSRGYKAYKLIRNGADHGNPPAQNVRHETSMKRSPAEPVRHEADYSHLLRTELPP